MKYRVELLGYSEEGPSIHIPSYVIWDPDLTLRVKGLYICLCGLVENQGSNRISKRRDEILEAASIGKNTYYRNIQPLIKNGYLRRILSPCKTMPNSIILIRPSKFSEGAGKQIYLLAELVSDPRLSNAKKAFYGYLCAISKNGVSQLDTKIASHELCIRPSYISDMLEDLCDFGYITTAS